MFGKFIFNTRFMKFAEYLDAAAPCLLIKSEWGAALIKYRILKQHIASMSSCCAVELPDDFECPICLFPFGARNQSVTTSCGHRFHPNCLIKTLISGLRTSCPLCPRKSFELVPAGDDGDCLRFLAMLYVNARAVHVCIEESLTTLEARLRVLQTHFSGSFMEAQLQDEATSALAQLEATVRFGQLNCLGFRKILRKFDKRTGYGVAAAVMADLSHFGFIRTALCEEETTCGGGRCSSLRNGLHGVLLHLQRSASSSSGGE